MSEIIYSWVIRKLECTQSENDMSNVIKIIHWTYQAKDENKYAKISNQYPLNSPTSIDNYIEYSELTEAVIIEWLENNLDVNYLRFLLKEEIRKSYIEPIVPLPLPWNLDNNINNTQVILDSTEISQDSIEDTQEIPTELEESHQDGISETYVQVDSIDSNI